MRNIELIPPKRKLNLSMSSNDLKPFGMLKANSNKVTHFIDSGLVLLRKAISILDFIIAN